MKIFLVLASLTVLLICAWLFKRLNVKNPDASIYEAKKKFFPARMKLPEDSGQPGQKIKE
jgi:hypothetical protein